MAFLSVLAVFGFGLGLVGFIAALIALSRADAATLRAKRLSNRLNLMRVVKEHADVGLGPSFLPGEFLYELSTDIRLLLHHLGLKIVVTPETRGLQKIPKKGGAK